MTTGRINQVTTVRMHRVQHQILAPQRRFLQWGFITRLSIFCLSDLFPHSPETFSAQVLMHSEPMRESPCTSDLTYFRHDLSVSSKRTKITAFREDYQAARMPSKRKAPIAAAYPQVINCKDGFSHRQVIHILLQHRSLLQKNSI